MLWRTVGQIPQKCKETSNWCDCHWYGLLYFCLFVKTFFVQIANLRIKCVTETKNVSVLFCKNLKSSLSFVSEVSLHSWLIWPTVVVASRECQVPDNFCIAAHNIIFITCTCRRSPPPRPRPRTRPAWPPPRRLAATAYCWKICKSFQTRQQWSELHHPFICTFWIKN